MSRARFLVLDLARPARSRLPSYDAWVLSARELSAGEPHEPVSVRRWGEGDAAELAALYVGNREEIIATEPWRTATHFTEEGQRSRIHDAARQESPFVGWVVLKDDVIVGTVGLDQINDGCATLGYWIDASHRRRGLATAGVGLVIEVAFAVMDLQRVVANTLPSNNPSVAVLRHLGFESAGTVTLPYGGEHLRFVLTRGSRHG